MLPETENKIRAFLECLTWLAFFAILWIIVSIIGQIIVFSQL